MNILIVTPYLPFPLSAGGKVSQFAFIDYLRRQHNITLAVPVVAGIDHAYAAELQKLWPEVEIAPIVIKPENESVFVSVKKRLKKVYNFLNKVAPAVYDTSKPETFNLTSAKGPHFISQINSIYSKKKFDFVQVEFIDYIDLALALPVETKKVFVHHEIRFARLESELKLSPDKYFNNYALNYVKSVELNYLKQYNGVFTFSDIDKNKLLDLAPELNVYSSPFPVLDSHFIPADPDFKVEKIVFIGGEDHFPNQDAVDWYCKEILPLIASKNAIKTTVIGNWSDSSIKERKHDQINFAGYVDDLVENCKNSVMIVPLRIGSGIRTKVLYAMAQGIPVISTSIGCEGINVENGVDILIEDEPGKFAAAILKLINDAPYARLLAASGQNFVKSQFGQNMLSEKRSSYYEEILNN